MARCAFTGNWTRYWAELLHKPLSDRRIYYLLLVALYQLQYSKAAQHAVVDHAVRSAQLLNVKVGGLVNAILRNFFRKPDRFAGTGRATRGRGNTVIRNGG